MNAVFPQLMVLEPYAPACGAPYLTSSSLTAAMGRHPLYWDAQTTAAWIFFFGTMMMGIDARTSKHPGQAFWDAAADGSIFMHSTAADLQSIGLSLGSATKFIEKRSSWLGSYSWPPSDNLDPTDETLTRRLIGEPFDVSLTFTLEKINQVDEEASEFEVELFLILTWEDNKIFARCQNAGASGEFDARDPCGLFWQPALLWPNVVLDPHPAATLTPATIEDFGLTTLVGKKGAEAAGGTSDPPSKVANNSIGMRMYRVRGTFTANLDFVPP